MKTLEKEFKKNGELHHAYCLEGDRGEIFLKVFGFLEKNFNLKTKGNPDVWIGEYDVCLLANAEEMKERMKYRSLSGGRRFFVLSFRMMMREAQNSLLKILEEPVFGAHVFLITENSENLLPALRSRLEKIKIPKNNLSDKKGCSFLEKSPAERLSFISKIVEDKDKDGAILLLNEIESALYSKGDISKYFFIFKEIEKCRFYLSGRSPSLKLILEHLSLIVPVFLL